MVMLDSNTVNKTVTLDGHVYVVSSHIVEDNASEFAATINQTAPQYDERNPPVSTFTMDSWTGGIGIKRANFREHQGRYWYGNNIDTRFANQLTLGPLTVEAASGAGIASGENYSTTTPACYAFFNGKEYFGFRDKVYSWNGSSATEVLDVGSGGTAPSVNSLAVFTNSSGVAQIYAFLQGANDFWFSDTGDNADWTKGTSTLGRFGLEYDKHFIVIGGTDTVYQVDTADTADGALASYTTLFLTGNATSNGYVPRWAILFRNAAGDIVPYVMMGRSTAVSPYGRLHVMDYYARRLDPVDITSIQLPYNDTTAVAVWNNSLYLLDLQGSVFKYDVDAYQDIGLTNDQGAAVSVIAQGHYPQHLAASQRWLYLAATDSTVVTSFNNDIMAYNGIGWHPLVVGQGYIRGLWRSQLSPGRIYFVSGTNSATTTTLNYISEAIGGNPVNDTSYTYWTSGYLITPWYDLGFVDLTKTLLSLSIDGEGLTSTEKVTVSYQIDSTGADDFSTGVTALTAFTATNTSVSFGTIDSNNNYPGIACRQVRFKIALARGATTTNTPIVRALVLRYLVNVPYRLAAQFTVDIGATITNTGAPFQRAEDVVSALKTTYGKTTLVDYAYGNDAVRKVKMVTMPVREWATETGARDGQISVQVLQPVV